MYTLRFPFQVPIDQEIAVDIESWEYDGLDFRMERQDPWYLVTASGFASEVAARNYLENVRAGFMWVLLHTGVAVKATFDAIPVTYSADPEKAAENFANCMGIVNDGRLDGLFDGGHPAIYFTGKRLRTVTMGRVTIVSTTPVQLVIGSLQIGTKFRAAVNPNTEGKLLVAFDLYAAFFTETSNNARFLTLVMALETLAVSKPRNQCVLALLDRWAAETDTVLTTFAPDSMEYHSIEALRRELLFKKNESIRQQVRSVVEDTLAADGDADSVKTATRAVKVYDLRSTLVHTGVLKPDVLDAAISDAKSIVERVLRARMQSAVPPHSP